MVRTGSNGGHSPTDAITPCSALPPKTQLNQTEPGCLWLDTFPNTFLWVSYGNGGVPDLDPSRRQGCPPPPGTSHGFAKVMVREIVAELWITGFDPVICCLCHQPCFGVRTGKPPVLFLVVFEWVTSCYTASREFSGEDEPSSDYPNNSLHSLPWISQVEDHLPTTGFDLGIKMMVR